jgi:hypothetical protein
MEPTFEVGGWGPVPEEMKHHPKISVSGLVEICKSPAHYESRYILKEGEETKAMKLGTAVHMALLEPERFAQTYAVHPGDPPEGVLSTVDQMKDFLRKAELKTTGNKPEIMGRIRDCGIEAELEDDWFKRVTEGREVIKPIEMLACKRLVERVESRPTLKFMISGGEPEKLGWVLHRRSQVVISFKADYVKMFRSPVDIGGIMTDGVVTDVKKVQAAKANAKRFGFIVDDMNLHVQAAVYVDVMSALYNKRVAFMWMPAEEKPPFVITGLTAPEALIEAGRIKYENAINTFLKCRKTNQWPLNVLDIEDVDMTSWFWEKQQPLDEDPCGDDPTLRRAVRAAGGAAGYG